MEIGFGQRFVQKMGKPEKINKGPLVDEHMERTRSRAYKSIEYAAEDDSRTRSARRALQCLSPAKSLLIMIDIAENKPSENMVNWAKKCFDLALSFEPQETSLRESWLELLSKRRSWQLRERIIDLGIIDRNALADLLKQFKNEKKFDSEKVEPQVEMQVGMRLAFESGPMILNPVPVRVSNGFDQR